MADIDSYSESNQTNSSTQGVLAAGGLIGMGQSFTGDGQDLGSAKFYLLRANNPPNNVYAKLYAHSGTFGSSSVPTGSALATSDAVSASSLSAYPDYALCEFTFSTPYTTTNGTYYVLTVEYNDGDGANYVGVGHDVTTPTHGGNMSYFHVALNFWYYANYDVCFYAIPAAGAPSWSGYSFGVFVG